MASFIAPLILKQVADPVAYPQEISFLKIRIMGLPFLFLFQMGNAFLVASLNSRYLMIGFICEAGLNIVLDFLLIKGRYGFPALGFNGAAVASIIAEFTGMFIIFLVISQQGIAKKFSLFSKFTVDKENAASIMKVSGPLAFQHAASILAWFFFYVLVARNASQTGLAVSTTMRAVFGFFGTFFWALAATTNSMVSNIIGQGRKEEVFTLIKKISTLSLGIAVIVCTILNLFPGVYLSLFRNDAQFIETGIPVLRAIAFIMLILSVGTIWLSAVTGTGNSKITFLIEIVAISFYCVYVFVVLEMKHYSILWGWLSEFLYWTILFGCSYYYMRTKKWQSKII